MQLLEVVEPEANGDKIKSYTRDYMWVEVTSRTSFTVKLHHVHVISKVPVMFLPVSCVYDVIAS